MEYYGIVHTSLQILKLHFKPLKNAYSKDCHANYFILYMLNIRLFLWLFDNTILKEIIFFYYLKCNFNI